MVFYENIKIGAIVEVSLVDTVCMGKVCWKGLLASRPDDDWVGLELEVPVGKHDGVFEGRRYFTCKNNHGVFVQPAQVRFSRQNQRRSVGQYRVIRKGSYIDETLFGSSKDAVLTGEAVISKTEKNKLREPSAVTNSRGSWLALASSNKSFHLPHAVSKCAAPSSIRRRQMSLASSRTTSLQNIGDVAHRQVSTARDPQRSRFISPPSIPLVRHPSAAQLAW